MHRNIEFEVKGEKYFIPNRWEDLSETLFARIVFYLDQMAKGVLAPAMVRILYVCDAMDWNPEKINDEDAFPALVWLGNQVTFPFLISYPNNDEALKGLPKDEYDLCKKTAPDKLKITIGKYLSKLDWRYSIDSFFCKQIIPTIRIEDESFGGYLINSEKNMLSCTLTALQFIEAKEVCGDSDKLSLLAAILYYPGKYSSQGAHRLSTKFDSVDINILRAIAFNFAAFCNYIFTETDFSLLTENTGNIIKGINSGPTESLYSLSAEGYGDIETIENINIIKYLTLLRTKLINAVRTLNNAEMKITEISEKTSLPIHIINKILC